MVIRWSFFPLDKIPNKTPCGANAQLQLLLENSKSRKGHNYVKKVLKVTCPSGMGSPFDVNNLSEFQVNIFSNDRDIRKSNNDDDNRAMTIPQHFLKKKKKKKKLKIQIHWITSHNNS